MRLLLKKISLFYFFFFPWFPRMKHRFGRPQLHGCAGGTDDFPQALASGVVRVPWPRSRRPRPCLVLPVTARCPSTDAFLSPVPPPGCDNGRAAAARCLLCSSQASAAGASPSAAESRARTRGASLPLGARLLPKSFAMQRTKPWGRLDALRAQ